MSKKTKTQRRRKITPKRSSKSSKAKTNANKIATSVGAQTSSRAINLRPNMNRKKGVSAICALTDPFCTHAKGARWPDGSSGSTIPYQLRGFITLSTDANGAASLLFQPQLFYCYSVNTYTTTPSAGWNVATSYSQITDGSLPSLLDHYRITTCGLIIRPQKSATNSQGNVLVKKFTTGATNGDFFPVASMLGVEPVLHPCYLGIEIPLVSRPTGASARVFAGTNLATTNNLNWEGLWVEVINGPASSANYISIEYFINIEFTLNQSSLHLNAVIPATTNTNSTKLQQAATSTLNKMTSSVSNTLEDYASNVVKHAGDSLMDVLTGALDALFI